MKIRIPESFDERFRGQQFAWIWAVAMFAGAIAITMSPPGPDLSFARLAVPMIILVGYAWIGYKRCREVYRDPALHEARVAQLADSLYFLGFLWTLWALIDSFVLKNLAAATGVFRIFGYALVTTAAGMFARMLLLQFRYSGDDQIAVAEATVEDRLSRFSDELKKASESMQTFQVLTGTAVKDWHVALKQMNETVQGDARRLSAQVSDLDQTLSRTHSEALERIYATVQAAVMRLVDEMRVPEEKLQLSVAQSLKTMSELDGRTRNGLDLFERALGAGAAAAKSELEDFARRVSEIRVPADFQVTTNKMTEQVRGVEDALSCLIAALKKEREIDSAFEDVGGHLRDGVERVGNEVNSLAARIQRIQLPAEVTLHVNEINGKMRELERGLSNLSAAFDHARSISENFTDLPAKIEGLAESLEKAQRNLRAKTNSAPEEPFSPPVSIRPAPGGRSERDFSGRVTRPGRWMRLRTWIKKPFVAS